MAAIDELFLLFSSFDYFPHILAYICCVGFCPAMYSPFILNYYTDVLTGG